MRTAVGSTVEAVVGVDRSLSIAEVARMMTATNASGNAGLLDGFTDQDAVLLELFSEDGVEKGIATTVEGKDEHCQDFGSF